jgi:hypothetical protein
MGILDDSELGSLKNCRTGRGKGSRISGRLGAQKGIVDLLILKSLGVNLGLDSTPGEHAPVQRSR